MTSGKDSDRATELKKMDLCDACAGIQRNWRRAPGHAELVQGGHRREEHSGHVVTITRHVCERCGTRWEYTNDKRDQRSGWAVVGR